MDKFTSSYKNLNPKQKEAVDNIEGPVMVIAGPGTGKTSILTLRIANILEKTDSSPESILALTFTDSGVKAIKEKLAIYLGTRSYQVSVFTFHSFCSFLQEKYPEYFEDYIGFDLISEVMQIQSIEKILEENDYQYIKTLGTPFFFLKNIISEIKDIKREGVLPDLFKKYTEKQKKEFYADDSVYNKKSGKIKSQFLSKEKKILRSQELADVYHRYESYLKENKLKDYEDVLLFTIKILENNEDFLRIIQEEYQYLLADEHQDANNAQNRIIELLTSYDNNPNLFIVGDEKQAIYRFQGASLENFLYFKKKYKKAKIIQLDTNYRSTQNVLDNAFCLIQNNQIFDKSLLVNLKSVKKESRELVEVHDFFDYEDELVWIVQKIKDLIADGVEPDNISIIFRKNSELFDISKILAHYKIPFYFNFQKNILDSKEAGFLLNLFRVVERPDNKEAFIELLSNHYSAISLLDVYKISKELDNKNLYTEDLLDLKKLSKLKLANPDSLITFSQKIKELRRYNKDHSVLEFIDYAIESFDVIGKIYNQDDGLKNLKILKAIYKEIKEIVTNHKNYNLIDIANYFGLVDQYDIKTKISVGNKSGVWVQVAHQTKGLEYDYVFIANLVSGNWGKKRQSKYFSSVHQEALQDKTDEDERRLFYVALTRARKKVFCSYSKTGEEKREKIPSQFITELNPDLIKKVSHENQDNSEFYSSIKTTSASTDELLTILPDLFLSRSLSVSAINKYLTCPWEFIFINMLRVPKSYTWSQIYGQVIHSTLKDFFDLAIKENKVPSKKLLTDLFNQKTKEVFLTDSDKSKMRKEGIKILSGYYDTYKKTWQTKDIVTEFQISNIPFVINEETTIRLTGNLDKIEYQNTNICNVVDYKTSTPKSKSYIDGTVKGSDGNYKRQLIFYKLLLKNKGIEMKQGTIDFLNPNQSGLYKKVTLELDDNDVLELETEIRKISEEILSGEWINRKCKEKFGKCQWCKKAKERNYLID